MKIKAEKPCFPLVWRPVDIRNASGFFGVSSGLGLVSSIVANFTDASAKAGPSLAVVLFLFLPVFLGSCFGWIYALRTCVEANDIGLRWRSWRGVWRSTKWEDVTDFWLDTPKGLSRTVETPVGLVVFDKASMGQAISDLVVERAVNAKIRAWQIKGERLCDKWPRRFAFSHPVSWWGLGIIICLCLAIVIWGRFFLLSKQAQLEVVPFSVWFLAYVCPILAALAIPLLLLGVACTAILRSIRHKSQSLEISPDYLLWRNKDKVVQASWNEVESWRWRPQGRGLFLQAYTTHGVIEIPESLPQFAALCRIIERFGGIELSRTLNDFRLSRSLTGGAENGELIFRMGRVELSLFRWLLGLFIVVLPVSPWLMKMADPTGPKLESWGPTAFLLGLLVVLEWWARSHWICVTEQALEQHGPRWNRAIPWVGIEAFGRNKEGRHWVQMNGEQINLSRGLFTPAPFSQLLAEIERRAVNAQGSWEKLEQNGKGSE